MNPWRVVSVLALMLPACVAFVLLLFLLPPAFSFGCMLTGLVLFKIGADLGWKWSTVVGGACMFSGAFVAALSGVLGPRAA